MSVSTQTPTQKPQQHAEKPKNFTKTSPLVQLKNIRPELTQQWQDPHYATNGSAAMDLRACIRSPLILGPGECELIPTGYAIYMQDPTLCSMILPRSGLGHKHGIVLGNSVGLIDSDYQGELMISCLNRSDLPYTITPGDRIAQLIFLSCQKVQFECVEEFEQSERGTGGFGHTGNK
jgi:dUTP pyrophosphatase